MSFGLMLAYWVKYGFYFHPGNVQWRFPLLFQLVFAVHICVGNPLSAGYAKMADAPSRCGGGVGGASQAKREGGRGCECAEGEG